MDILKRLHTSVAQTFENTFDDAYKDLQAQLSQHEARASKAEERARSAENASIASAAEIEKLRKEIELLREELYGNNTGSEDAGASADFLQRLEETYSPQHVMGFCESSSSTHRKPDEKELAIILDRYPALYSDAYTLADVSGKLKEQVKRQKQKLLDWQKRLYRDEFTIVLEGVPAKFKRIQNIVKEIQTPQPMIHTPAPIEYEVTEGPSTSRLPRHGSDHNSHTVTSLPAHKSPKDNFQLQGHEESTYLASTQSNSSNAGDEIERDGCNVLHRQQQGTLKRKGILLEGPPSKVPDYHSIRENQVIEQPVVIKKETMLSSPPEELSQVRGTIGTQDLDETGSTVETPTKRRTRKLYQSQGVAPSHMKSQPGRQLELQYQDQIAAETHSRWSTTLQPVDGNLRYVSSRFSNKTPARNPEKMKKYAISSVAEDGDENHTDLFAKNQTRESGSGAGGRRAMLDTDNLSLGRRLHDLLEQPLPLKQPLSPSSGELRSLKDAQGHRRNVKCSKSEYTEKPDNRLSVELPSETNQPGPIEQQSSNNIHTYPETDQDPITPRPEDEPYRARPLHRLQASHFKINPDNNQGLDYVFDTVVRKKDERKHLTGCTRKGCCGDHFRAMARLNLDHTSPVEEQRLLEEYLGEDRNLLIGLPERDRLGLLHEAQARRMANTFGKHRHQHQRPGTPPGFWRTEMPDTQELEHDREQARVVEREKVEERYREAMRPHGLWKFADE
ncbi:Peroxisomal membrane protein pex16 [Aspergillus nanangensis]|uniref:Peroxisomal membrane protein pex16 n=1 Tax=Aspergillus nanangensis TaxID=2582783 RepID=A0AAD4GQF7_ASPNN|nr:Peroxisomal membrane protein pex16 [Aspergillus nanangensis]